MHENTAVVSCVYVHLRISRNPVYKQHAGILVCALHLHDFMSISVHECIVSVVKAVDLQLHNRELHPTRSLKLHRRDPCDL